MVGLVSWPLYLDVDTEHCRSYEPHQRVQPPVPDLSSYVFWFLHGTDSSLY